MASRPILSRQRVNELLISQDPIIRKAFLEAFDDIRDGVDIQAVARALERGDIEAAVRAMNLDPAAFRLFERAITDAYAAGGIATIEALPILRAADGLRVVVRFDVRNFRAESWLRDHSSKAITNIIYDQERGIRQALVSGLERGVNPRTTALDIVGRLDRTTGKRQGGIIGLTSHQEHYVDNARAELLSGDTSMLRNYLTRERRDARFDSHVLRAINGEAIDADTVSKMVGRYSDSLLQLRGETIARTETMVALNAARAEAMQQAIDSGAVRADQVTKVWRSAGDNRVRETHRDMNGQTVRINEKFVSPSGALLEFPGDPSAPVEEVINCRCTYETRIDFLADIE